jgi:thiol-disulfide isomerase/thioredoxin
VKPGYKEERMNRFIKATICGLIVTLVLLSGGISFSCTSPSDSEVTTVTPTDAQTDPTLQPEPGQASYVELVYFHRTRRCHTCQYAGDMTQHVVETYFFDEVTNGKLLFKTLDAQDPENAAMVNKYGAYGSSLFINEVIDGEDNIQSITSIWYKIDNDEEFISALKTDMEKALGNI